jgi:queuine tRNA-ribosyltransferase
LQAGSDAGLFRLSDNYQLVRTPSGAFSIHSRADNETFHPVAGPSVEAETLYVRQLNLRERAANCRDEFVIWDVGLGAAGNSVTALRALANVPSRVRLVSFDRTTEPLQFALRHARELEFLSAFTEPLSQLTVNHRTEFTHGQCQVRWELHVHDFPSLIQQAAQETHALPAPHAILYDAFSPARNPEMWMQPLLHDLFTLLLPDRPCSLATFSRSTIARTALLLAGFFVGPGEPLAGKEETTVAANTPSLIPKLLDATWLGRARRSHGAEPLHGPQYVQQALTAQTSRALESHPQFQRAQELS